MKYLRRGAPRVGAVAAIVLITCSPTVRAGNLDDVIAADQAFAPRAADSGTQAAFQAFLAPDAILFRPRAVNGQEWLRSHEEATGRLEWSPATGAVACDGSIAVTLGPWTYRQDTAVSSGHYLTVWRRRDDGEWQVVLDHGIDGPEGAAGGATVTPAFAAPWANARERSCDKPSRGPDLAATDAGLNDELGRNGIDRSLQRARLAGALALRDGHAPAVANGDWPHDDRDLGEQLGATTLGIGVVAGSDLGYSYGEYFARGQRKAAGDARALFVRIWVRDGESWKLLADLLTPL